MNRFWEDAMSVFETARQVPGGEDSAELNILIDGAGVVHMVAGEGWRPEALQAHYGARAVYQVTRSAGGVRVAGRSMGDSCLLESAKPAAMLAALGGGGAQYRVVGARTGGMERPAMRALEAGRNGTISIGTA
jgi:hypothetical protein